MLVEQGVNFSGVHYRIYASGAGDLCLLIYIVSAGTH